MDRQKAYGEIVTDLHAIHKFMKKHIHSYFKEFDFTPPQGMMVGMLMHHGKMKISDLSKKMGLSNSTVSSLVDRMEKGGHVERVRSNEDRRVVYVQMSQDLSRRLNSHEQVLEAAMASGLNQASDQCVLDIRDHVHMLLGYIIEGGQDE